MIRNSVWLQWVRSFFSDNKSAGAIRVRRSRSARRKMRPVAVEGLEDRVLLAATTFDSGTLTIDFSTAGEAVTIGNNGVNITISSTGSITGDGSSFATGTVTRVVVTDSGTLAAQQLTISGSADYSLSGGLDVTGAETANLSRAISTGTANLSVTTEQSIVVSGALSATDGDISLSANQQAQAASGNFYGIYVNQTSVTTTGTGAVTLLGRGGDGTILAPQGVLINSGTVSGKSTTVTGTGGETTINASKGVNLLGTSTITSTGGNVVVTGTGGVGGGTGNSGVEVTAGSIITATGDGTVTVIGTVLGTGDFSDGVYVSAANSAITSANGAVTIEGTGGTGASSRGVIVTSGGRVSAGGSGTVTVTGTGISTAGGGYGVSVAGSNALISANGGKVSITAISNGTTALGVAAASITSGANADIEITTNSISLSSVGTINSGSGQTSIKTYTSGTLVNLGGSDVVTGSPLTLGLTDAELDLITAGTLVIGDANTGAITVSAAITHGNNLTLNTGAGMNAAGRGITLATDKSLVMNAQGYINLLSNANLITTGTGSISVTTTYGINIQVSTLSTVDGNIQLSGNQQATPSTGFIRGVYLGSASVTASGNGGVTINGRGGDSTLSSQLGVWFNAATVSGKSVNITGTGGTGPENATGVFTNAGGSITSTGGGITITGYGGETTGNGSIGVELDSPIGDSGSGAVTVVGVGGDITGSGSAGVRIAPTVTTPTVTSAGGNISITGTARGTGADLAGIDMFRGGIAAGGNGTVILVAQGVTGPGLQIERATISSNNGVVDITADSQIGTGLVSGSEASVSSGGNADVRITANSIDLSGTLDSGTGLTSLKTYDATTPIILGGNDVLGASPTLGLSAAELNLITAGTLVIGAADAGDITVSSAVAPTSVAQLELVTGGQIIDTNATGADITVTRLGLTASAGIGVGNALDTAVSNLEATTVTGGIFVSNTGALTIGDVNGTLSGVRVTGTSGEIQIDTTGSLNVFETVIAPGSITLSATGTTSDITVAAGAEGVLSSAGDVTIFAGHDLSIGFEGTIGDTRSASGLLALSAGHDIVITDSSYAQGGAISATAGNDFSLINTALFYATGGNGTASVSSGGTLTVDSSNGGGGRRGITTNNGAITLTTDNLVVGALAEFDAGSADITVKTATDGLAISLGGTGSGLRIDDAAFDAFSTTGVLTIGRQESGGGANNSGNITFTSAINLANNTTAPGTLRLLTGGSVVDATGTGQTAVTVDALAVSATGAIGASGTPLKFAATTLTTDTASSSADQYLSEADSVTVGAADLKAGTATITLNSGTFQLAADQDILSNVVIASGATLGGTGTVNGNVSGAGNVSPGNSPGAITINGEFTPTGTVTFEVNPPGAIPGTDYDQLIISGTVDLSGATLVLTGATGAVGTNQIVTLIQNTSVNQIIPSASYADESVVTINGNSYRLFYNRGAGNNDLILVENSSPTTVYVDDNFTGNFGQTIDDADLGTSGNQPALFGINAFTTLADALAAVSSSGTVIVNAGTYAEAVSAGGTQTLTIGGADVAQVVTFSSLATVSGTTLNLAGTSSLTIGDATNTEIAGLITGGGSLTKQGAGRVTLSGDNDYIGATTISAGTLRVTANNALGSTAGDTTVASGAILDLRGVNYSSAEAVGLQGGIVTNSANALTTFNGTVTLSATGSFAVNDTGVLDMTGAILGPFGIQTTGAGTLRLSNTGNTFASINIAAGTVQLGASGVIPDTSDLLTSSVFDVNGFDEAFDSLAGNGSVTNSSETLATLTLGSGNNNSSSLLNGTISGAINLVKTGTGRQVLSSPSSSYTGTTTINNGTLAVVYQGTSTATQALGSASGGTIVNADGVLEFQNVSYGLAEPITVNGGTIRSTAGGDNPTYGSSQFSGPITLATGTATFELTTAATLTLTGVIDGDQGITKTGVGTLVLGADNTYSGNTTISAGKLVVDGSLASSSAVTVNNSGTLAGSGTINGTVNVASGGKVSPGNSPGVLHSGSVSFVSGSSFLVEVNGITDGSFDQLNVTGTVSLGNSTLNATGTISSNIGQQIVIINNDDDDAVIGTFNGLSEGAVFALNGLAFQISYLGGADGNDVVLTEVVPPNDVSVTVTDNMPQPVAGGTIIYTITVTNTGPFAADATSLIDNFPAAITSASWTSVAAGGASGNTFSGNGDIFEILNLPVGASVTYTVTATISAAAAGSLSNTATVTQEGDTNSDNDSATDTDVLENVVSIAKINDASEPSTNGRFRVTIAAATEHNTIVLYSIAGLATNGIDYETLTGSVTIPAGSTSADIDVAVLDDAIVEAGETVEVTLTGLSQPDPGVVLDSDPSHLTATVDLADDDTNVLTISAPVITETNADQSVTFTVTSPNAVAGGFDVAITTSNGTAGSADYELVTTTVHFTGTAGETQSVSVTIKGDMILEGNETFEVVLGAVSGTTTDQVELITSGARATGTINDDDNPVFIGDASASVPENTLISTVVLDVDVNDSLISSGYSVAYSLTGPDAGLFNINSATGEITFAASPDFENPADELGDNIYHITVTATANTDPTRSTLRDLTITVTPVNDVTPEFLDASPTFNVVENSAANTVVGTVSAIDGDLPAQSLTYSIISGNETGAFAINPATGQCTVADPTLLDYETRTSFTLVVRVSDNEPIARTADATVVVNVTNVDEGPTITIPVATGTYHLGKLPAFVSPDASFEFTDNPTPSYANATLTVSIAAGRSKRDKLTIFSKGTAAGQIHTKGKKVYFGSTLIGTLEGGKGNKPDLVVKFNSNATNAAVDNLLRRLNFMAKDNVGTNRTVTIQVKDVGGVDSNVATRDIAVVPRVDR